jgi:hypothetical protein
MTRHDLSLQIVWVTGKVRPRLIVDAEWCQFVFVFFEQLFEFCILLAASKLLDKFAIFEGSCVLML